MPTTSRGPALALVLAAAVLAAAASGPYKAAKESETDKPLEGASQPSRSPEQALSAFLTTEKDKELKWAEAAKRLKENYDIKSIIAMLPDPQLSQLGYRFDLALESIERALERERFVLDRWWLPWPMTVAGPEKDGGAEDVSPGKQRPHLAQVEHPAEKEPGLLLFRYVPRDKGDTSRRMLALFLVGELPTSGVHKVAMRRAMRLAGGLGDSPLRVLGPSFTGTQTSLAIVMGDWLEHTDKTREAYIACGGASGFDPAFLVDRDKDKRVTVKMTLHQRETVHKKLRQYLDGRRGAGKKTAWLVEANTAFGRQAPPWEHAPGDSSPADLILPFPLHVSQVRNVYNRERLAKDESLPRLPSSTSWLRLPFDDPAETRDIVPPLTGPMTAAAVELLLTRIIATLSREEISYVGIIATDARDKIFLAGLVHDHAPDVQLVSTINDSLLAHPNYYPYMQGMIVASTYPLYSRNQQWSPPYHQRPRCFEFSHSSHEGLFNATLVLLAQGKNNVEREKTLSHLREYGYPFTSQQLGSRHIPPVWINVIGRNRAWPVAAYPCDLPGLEEKNGQFVFEAGAIPATDEKQREVQQKQGWKATFPSLWCGLFILACAAVLVLAGYFALRSYRGGDGMGLPCEEFAPPDSPWRGWYAAWAGLFFLSFAAFFLLVLPLNWHAGGADVALIVLNCLAFWAALTCAVWPLLPPGSTAKPSSRSVAVCAAGTGVATALIGLFVLLRRPEPADTQVYLDSRLQLERAVVLTSGLSYVVPLALALGGVALWCFTRLSEVACLSRYRPSFPYPDFPGKLAFTQLKEADEALVAAVEAPLKGWPLVWWVAILLLFVVGLYDMGVRTLWTAEGKVIDLTVWAALVALLLCLVVGLVQAMLLWRRLARLLDRVVRLPMAAAYSRLPEQIASLFGRYLSARRSRRARLNIERHQFELLLPPPVRASLLLPPVDVQSLNLPPEFATAQQKVAAAPDHQQLDDALAEATRACVKVLAQGWESLPVEYAFDGPQPGKDGERDKRRDRPGLSAAPQDEVERWLQLAEDLVATRTVSYVGQYFVHLRNLATFLTAGSVLLLLGVSSYPFQPYRLMQLVAWSLVIGVAGVIVVYLVQMERNTFVSWVSGTHPNRVTLDRTFLGTVLKYIVPVTTLLALQIPRVGDVFRSFIEPIFRVMK